MTPAPLPDRSLQPSVWTRKRRHGKLPHAVILLVAVASLPVIAALVGCAALKDNEQIIRVRTARNSAAAARMTLAGVKALHEADIDRAMEKFLAAVDADEDYGPAHNNLGLMHYEQGNLYQAVLAFERAMELMPQDPAVYYNLGLTLETAGKVHEAMDLYWQAVEMDPVNPNFLGNLVRLRVRLGESDPTLVTQLQDLILIETRPKWRRWADRQLALNYNPALDRGPDPPDFDANESSSEELDLDAAVKSKIIELSSPSIGEDRRPPPPPANLPPPQPSSSIRELVDPPAAIRALKGVRYRFGSLGNGPSATSAVQVVAGASVT